MYFSHGLIVNSGPIEKLDLNASFVENRPKPLVLVGTNGSGKTNVLSIVGDALLEIAAQQFQDALPSRGTGHEYFRILGGRSQRTSANFEFSALKFTHGTETLYYRAKAAQLAPASIADQLTDFEPIRHWSETGSDKTIVGPTDKIEDIYNSGTYAFFPSSRYELPHWANISALDRDPEAEFTPRFTGKLNKPIVIQSAIQKLKPWIIDIILDRSIDAGDILDRANPQKLQGQIVAILQHSLQTYENLNAIISNIIREPGVRIVRRHRSFGERRISIAKGDEIIIPSLDNLSAGQSALLAMFGTLVRYCDMAAPGQPLANVEGMVLIDEIDTHLHADLQHDVLPKLLKLFPKVQFMVSTHAPLFVLGMRKEFSTDGFSLIEMPAGITIDPERFSEFESSLRFFQATQAFDATLRARVTRDQRPLVLTEGETDPKYLRTAAELLSADVAHSVDFDWVGTPAIEGAQGGGKSHLNDALKFLKFNPQFQNRTIILLYDPETHKPDEDFGSVRVRKLPQIPEARRKSGIENLLPDAVFEPRFFETKIMGKGDDRGPVPVLNKRELCDFLCEVKRAKDDFKNFQGTLDEIRKLIAPVPSNL